MHEPWSLPVKARPLSAAHRAPVSLVMTLLASWSLLVPTTILTMLAPLSPSSCLATSPSHVSSRSSDLREVTSYTSSTPWAPR